MSVSDIILPDCMMGPSDPCKGYEHLYSQLEALKKENEELKKEVDWRASAYSKLDDVNINLNEKLTEAIKERDEWKFMYEGLCNV